MQCKAKSKRSGMRCKNYAMKGKNVCRLHGGKSLVGPDCPSYKHGLYSQYDNPKAQGHIDAAKKLGAIQILEQTIPVAAGLLSFWLDTGVAFDPECQAGTMALFGRLTKAVDTLEKLTNPELRTGKLVVEYDYKDKSNGDLLDEIAELHKEAEAITRAAATSESEA